MSAEFDKEDAIRFYGKAAERFSEALAACIQKIQDSPTRFRQIAPNIRSCRVENFPYQLLFTLKRTEYTSSQSSTIGPKISPTVERASP
jgi:hypothetical protein